MMVELPNGVPDFLCHYYAAATGPLRNLSALPPAEAEAVQAGLRQAGKSFASRRAPDYLPVRRELEARAYALFSAKGGRPEQPYPHYLVVSL
jgi:hypothetical protein